MANIFKKIKTIDAVGDAPRTPKTSKAPSKDGVRLGLKPVLKASEDPLVDATDFKDPFGLEEDASLEIPDIEVGKGSKETPAQPLPVNEDQIRNHKGLTPTKDSRDIKPTPNAPAPPEKIIDISSSDEIDPAHQDDVPPVTKTIVKPETSMPPLAPETQGKKLHLHPIYETAPKAEISAADIPPASIEKSNITAEAAMSPLGGLPKFLSPQPQSRHVIIPEHDAPTWPFWALGGLAFLWIISSAAAAYGYFELGLDKLTAQPIHAFGFAGFVLLPACLLAITALLLRRMNSLSQESRDLAFLNQQLLTPSAQPSQAATNLADEITQQMDRIEQRADQALNRLTTVQSAFSAQIDDVAQTLTSSAQQQTTLDGQLRASKTAWTGSVKQTEQTISELSTTLDNVIESFQTRVDTTHDKLTHLTSGLQTQLGEIEEALTAQTQETQNTLAPLLSQAETLQDQLTRHQDKAAQLKDETADTIKNLDDILEAQTEKLSRLTAQQDALKSGKLALNAAWDSEDSAVQDRLFRHVSQIDALNDRTDALIKKIDQAAKRLTAATQKTAPLALRGTIKEEQLSLLPGLGAAKDMLPALLTPEGETDPAILAFDDIDASDLDESLYQEPRADIAQPLASQRILGGHDTEQKQSWFKRFGRRATDPVLPSGQVGPVSAPPAAPPPQPHMAPHITSIPLRDKLISMQLSPDALIDTGSVHHAAQLRIKDGPFAMSRYMATHLGAAIDYLRGLLPDDPVLRRQVYDMAAAYPLREQLDEKNEDMLIRIFETEAGREYLLCDAALNG